MYIIKSMSDLAKNEEEDFIFIFNDGRISSYTQNEILEVSPSFYYKSINNISYNKIKVPPSITKEDISSFIDVYKKGVISFSNNNSNNYMNFLEENIKILKFLQISEFFENDSFSLILINDYFIKGNKISNENALTLLKISYKKLNDLNKEGYLENYSENLDSAWFDLFMKCLEIIGCNLVSYFKDKEENFENNELSFFEKKIIDEIFEKFAKNLIINNYEIVEDEEIIKNNNNNNNNNNEEEEEENNNKYISISDLEHIIKFLSMNRKQNNFFDLLTNEYMKICSEENINEINNLPNPTFLLKLNVNEIETYYEEFKIENQIDSKNERKITFVVFYRKTDDSLNIGFKLSQDKNNNNNNENNNKIFGFNIITFISSIIIEEINACQINSKSITNNKSLYNIFKMNNFSKTLLKFPNIEYLTVKIYLKSCYLHSILCSYLLNNFNNLFFDPKISKISKQFFLLILRNKNINFIVSSDKKVIAFLNWLNDEINIKEDLSEIIEVINWENVSLNLLFEFVFKYEKIISNLELEHVFISAVENREIAINNNNNEEINEKIKKEIKENNTQIIKEIFYAAKKLNYVDLFIENKKLNKINNFEASNLMKNYSQNNTNLNTHVQSRSNLKLNNNNNNNNNNKNNNNNNNKNNNNNNNNNFYRTSSNFIEEEKDNKNEIDYLMNNKLIIKNNNVENENNNNNNNEKVIGEKEIILNQENYIKNKNINNNNNNNNKNKNSKNKNNENNNKNLLISNNSFKNLNKKNNFYFKNINNYILKKNYNTNINTITNKSVNKTNEIENNKNFNSIKSVKSKPKIISISKSKSKNKNKNSKKLIRNKSNLSIKSNNSEYYSTYNNENNNKNKKKLFTDVNDQFNKKTSTTKSSKKYLIKKRNSNSNNFNNNFTINNNKSFFNVNINTNLNISNNYSFINNNNNNNNNSKNKNNLFQNFNTPINQHVDNYNYNNNNSNVFYLKKNDKKKNFNLNVYNNNNNNSLLNQMKHLKIIKKENKHKNLNSFGNDCKFKKINFINNKK